jgi:hypothetical protein
MASVSAFKDAIASNLAEKHLNIELWRGTPRRSSNLLEINSKPISTILYVKYSKSDPGFWGLTKNQLDRLNKSKSLWFAVLLARSMKSGYVFTSNEINKRIADGTFELSSDGDHKVNERADCRFGQAFQGLNNLVTLIL